MRRKIVINTGPVLALVAGLGNLELLSKLYDEVYVTKEVGAELMVDGIERFAAKEFEEAGFLIKIKEPLVISHLQSLIPAFEL